MISSDFRAEARKKLQGRWKNAVILTLGYMAIFFVLGFIEGLLPEESILAAIWNLATVIIEIPLAFGFLAVLLKFYKGDNEVKAFDYLKIGTDNFKRSWALVWYTFLKMLVPVILVIVSYAIIYAGSIGLQSSNGVSGLLVFVGVILLIGSYIWMIPKSYLYQLAMTIAVDRPELTSKEAVEKSEELMMGNRWKLFCLQLSFIGWAILVACTFGIGFLWFLPYVQCATFAFYMFVNGDKSTVETKVEDVKETSNDDNNPIQEG